VESGVSREDAYRIVQSHAMRAWKEGLNFYELVTHDPAITDHVSRKQIDRAFDLQRQLRNIDKIFARVFPTPEKTGKASKPAKKGKGRK
jgi:adenylosuccinate lyase